MLSIIAFIRITVEIVYRLNSVSLGSNVLEIQTPTVTENVRNTVGFGTVDVSMAREGSQQVGLSGGNSTSLVRRWLVQNS